MKRRQQTTEKKYLKAFDINGLVFHCFTFVGNKMRCRQKIYYVEQTTCLLDSGCQTERANDNITSILYFLSMGYLISEEVFFRYGGHEKAFCA